MTTVASRTFRSTPHRDALATWTAIVDLLTRGRPGGARTELLAISGVAASVIADQAPKESAIVVICDGPRTRIYCTYDDDAINGSDANEDPLGFEALNGNWRVSLPCQTDDLTWVQNALKQHGTRITARDQKLSGIAEDSAELTKSASLVFNPQGFLGS